MTKIRSTDDSNIQDRRGQGGGGMSLPGLGGGGGGIPMRAGGGVLGIIVMLAAVFLPRLLGGANSAAPSTGGNEVPAGQGDACSTEAEQIVCGAVESAQAYWRDAMPKAFNEQYQETDLVFFSGATNTGCGQATSQTGPFYCPADSYVYIDLDFLAQLQAQFQAPGDLASQYIVAHEFGHHIQNLLGTNDEVAQAQQSGSGDANELSVALELQADCYAGTWASSVQGQFENPQEVDEAINAAEAVGDDRIQEQTQGRVDPDSFTHGTSDQRSEWFRRGFTTGDPNQCDTFAELGLN